MRNYSGFHRLASRLLASCTLMAASCFAQVAPLGYFWYPDQTVGNTIAREIAVGRGEVWIIDAQVQAASAGPAGNFNILHLVGNQFVQVPGRGLKIAVDGTGTPWVVTAQGQIQRYNSTAQRWDVMPGGATEIAAGGGEVWVLGGTTRGIDNNIYRWNGRSWDRMPGQGAKLSVSSSGAAYVANTHGELWKLPTSVPRSWAKIAVGVNQVNATPNSGGAGSQDVVMITSTSGLVNTLSNGLWYASNGAGAYPQGPSALRIARDEFRSLRAFAILADPLNPASGRVVIGDPNEDATYAAPVIANTAVTPVPAVGFWLPSQFDSAAPNGHGAQEVWLASAGVGRNWMSFLPDNTPLHKLSIPGTHDSGSQYQYNIDSYCQNWTTKEQLEGGIRYFDFRVQSNGSELVVYHGTVDQHLKFYDVMSAIDAFLRANPREAIIMRIVQTGVDVPGVSTENLFRNLKYAFGPTRYGNVSSMTPRPTLGNLRGKIFFLREGMSDEVLGELTGIQYPRFAFPQYPTDTSGFYVQDAAKICFFCPGSSFLGDGFETANPVQKAILIARTLQEASRSDNVRLVLNHTSGQGLDSGILFAYPQRVAFDTNPYVSEALAAQPIAKRTLGTIIMDFPGEKLVAQILRTNFRFD